MKNDKFEVLGQINSVKIVRLESAAIPLIEGIHLLVQDENSIPWNDQRTIDILHKMYYALSVSKLISGDEMQDLWANIILTSNKKFNSGVNVFGRNPSSREGWGKAVRIKETIGEEIPNKTKEILTSTLKISLPLWSELLKNINLFEHGVEKHSNFEQTSNDEYEFNQKKNEKIIWANEKLSVAVVKMPHLNGLHLVVQPVDSYWESLGGFYAPWQLEDNSEISIEILIGGLEAAAILIGCKKILLEELGMKFYNPEIHFSGNWSIEINKDLNKKIFKKDFNKVHGGIFHGHLYATRDSQKYVSLPTRPKEEVPDEWVGIEPLSAGEEAKISEMIGKTLTPWLEQNAQGKLSD